MVFQSFHAFFWECARSTFFLETLLKLALFWLNFFVPVFYKWNTDQYRVNKWFLVKSRALPLFTKMMWLEVFVAFCITSYDPYTFLYPFKLLCGKKLGDINLEGNIHGGAQFSLLPWWIQLRFQFRRLIVEFRQCCPLLDGSRVSLRLDIFVLLLVWLMESWMEFVNSFSM